MTLSLSKQPQVLRTELATAFSLNTGVDLSWQLGQLSDTPSTAFFIGYQVAMRCLDPKLPAHEWAAFAVSEKGVRNPFLSQTIYDSTTGLLEGNKSHLMLVSSGLDTAYILAKKIGSTPVELVLLKVETSLLRAGPTNPQPFLLEVPHHSVSFSTTLPKTALFCENAHQQANKPFRYWEDVNTTLSLTGWLQAHLPTTSEVLEQAVVELIGAFKKTPATYSLTTLTLVEQLIERAQLEASNLTHESKELWLRDTQLLKFSQAVRNKVRQSLLKSKG